MNRRTALITACAFAAQGLAGCGGGSEPATPAPPPPPAGPATVTTVGIWNEHITATVAAAQAAGAGLFSNTESRLLAIVFAAMHDTLNAIDRRYAPWRVDLRASAASADAAIAAAARDTLVALLPGQSAFVQMRYDAELAKVPAGAAKDAGVNLGRQVAAAILAARDGDGASQSEAPYTPASQSPGVYQKTPDTAGNPVDPLGVRWGAVRPFVLTAGNQFRSSFDRTRYSDAGPLAIGSAEYAAELNEVRDLGARSSPSRIPYATDSAQFWRENSPPQWNRVAVQVARTKRLNGWDEARLYAALHLAMADSLIANYDAKYHYAFWRPITAVRVADDGNPATVSDPAWQPLFDVTPPTPDYPSAHGAAGGAASAVLVAIFGTNGGQPAGTPDTEPDEDNNPFELDSATLPGVRRQYRSFRIAARENAVSRKYAGIHFKKAVYDGRQQGREVGEFVMANALRPV